MPTFDVFWGRWLLAMALTGIVLVLFLFYGFSAPSRPGRPVARPLLEKWPAAIEVAARGIPPVLLLLYVLIGLYIIGHTLYFWLVKANS